MRQAVAVSLATVGSVFGSVTYSDRTGYTTMGTSVSRRRRTRSDGLRSTARISEPRGDFAMTKSCGSASEWWQTVVIACESEGFASGKRHGLNPPGDVSNEEHAKVSPR
jgi:hypothetical protein